jgi:hypothetical protein
VAQGQRNASAEYARELDKMKMRIGQLSQIVREGEAAVEAAIDASPLSAKVAKDPERRRLLQQVEQQEKAIASLRTQVAETKGDRR